MKPRRFFILLVMLLSWIVLPAFASRLGDIRVNARFLTDRMAYELRLTNRQYDDIFEINYDFFYNVDPYIDRMSYGDPYALDMYYRYLDERNDDIRWVLSRKHYKRFMRLEHFFLPIYAVNRVCYIRIYNIYPNRTHFYYGRPAHYFSYHGGHCRHHCGGVSFYQTHYRKHYRHAVYTGNYQSVRTQTRRRDFPVGNQSGTSVSRPVRSDRHSAVTEGNRSNVRRRTTDNRRTTSDVTVNPSVVRTGNSQHSGVRHRSHGTEVRNRSNSSEVRNRSHRGTIRQRSSESQSRSRSDSSTRTERSERRGVRER